MLQRLLINLFGGWFRVWQWFPRETMLRLRDAVSEGERHHAGELCIAIEARYSPWAVLTGLHTRQRAAQVFSLLRVWDTQDNSGVLLYLQLAERRVELLADRGISARVDTAQWADMCGELGRDMRAMPAEQAVVRCLGRINALLVAHFPTGADNERELPDAPIVL